MLKIKVWVLTDKKTGEIMSYEGDKEVMFAIKKEYVQKEWGAEIRPAVIEIKVKGLDF